MQKICVLLCNAQRSWKKTFRIMKLTIGLLLITMLTATAAKSYSQTARLNLNLKDVTIVDIFREIEKTSEFGFFFKSEELNNEKRQTIKFSDATIDEVLKKVLDTNYSYKILDKNIVVTRGNLEVTQQQGKKVSGKVTDSAGGALPGVSVVVKGTTTGVITDFDGKYSLGNIPENAILQFSFVGMKTLEMKIGTQTSINIVLAEETVGIEEVVAIGYGTQKKVTLTGAIGTTTDKSFVDKPSSNSMAALQGAVAGLNIVKTTGKPGNEAWRFNIRGFSSNRQLDPLVVIDGVPYPTSEELQKMNSNDIESVSVLKDGAASIYGSRAAGGVILITTKKAKQEKTTITYNGTSTLQTIGIHYKVMDRKNWFSSNEIAMNNSSSAFPFAGLKPYYMGDKSDYVLLRNDPAVAAAVGGAFSDVADFGIFDTD